MHTENTEKKTLKIEKESILILLIGNEMLNVCDLTIYIIIY